MKLYLFTLYPLIELTKIDIIECAKNRSTGNEALIRRIDIYTSKNFDIGFTRQSNEYVKLVTPSPAT